MGQSTDGQLWYGVVFEDGYEFPWPDYDIEDWWRTEQGFDASRGYPAEGWLDYQKAFDAEHPCPVELINYCSGEYPMYGLAIPASKRTASRGYPERLDGGLGVVTEAEKKALLDFCAKYGLKPESSDGWYLSSYWG